MAKTTVQVLFRTSTEIHERLTHHAERLGSTINSIVRESTVSYLDLLDEKEELQKSRKNGRSLIPDLPQHSKPRGLGSKKPPVAPSASPNPFAALTSADGKIPDKVKKAFRSWAEYLEEADGAVETDRRVKTVIKDLKERVPEEQVEMCYEAFVDFCTARKDAKEKAVIVNAPVSGDVR